MNEQNKSECLAVFSRGNEKYPASAYHRVGHNQIDTLPQFQTEVAYLGMKSGQRGVEMNEQNKSEFRTVFSRGNEKGSSQNMPLSSS